MKKLSIIAAIAALAFLGMACTKNDPNGGSNSNFPEINTFVETYFSRTSIQKIETDNDEIEKKHNGGWEIELDNDLEIEFDQDFNVIEVDDK